MNLTQTPKIVQKGPKKAEKVPKNRDKKQKDWAVQAKPKLIVYISRSKKNFEPNPNPKTTPKGPKRAKKAPYGVE